MESQSAINLAEYMNEHKENSGDPYIMAALFIQDNKTEFPSVTPQEPILDKLRAEMKPYTDPKGFIVIGENRFNMILDRCKAESEGKEQE